MKLVLLGAPASGKGTQAKLLAKYLGIPNISAGQLIRECKKNGDEDTRKMLSVIDKGEFVPDAFTLSLLKSRLKNDDCQKGYILDGYPRSKNQVKDLMDNFEVDKVIFLDVNEDVLLGRVLKRAYCANCKIDYVGEEFCSKCGEKLTKRTDDTEEVLQNRLRIFREETLPLVEFFEKKGMLVKVDANQTPEKVQEDLLKLLHI